ncbi:MAG TPA: hypothetical protein DCM28_10510 [Phycisphaerales bacterium]|nr:hypothetical protein [Phycisphaerales bacterium]HCD34556.1 hypothetical protein [Phycisphaerales bacterium]
MLRSQNNVPIGFEPMLNHLPAWMLVLFRIAGIFFMAPVFGSTTIPVRFRMLLSVAVACCVYPMLIEPGRQAMPNVMPIVANGMFFWTMAPAVAMEMLIGVLIGFGASLPIFGMQVGGRIVDQQMGLGIAGVYNPEVGEEVGVISEFFFMLSLTIFILIGGLRVVLTTLVGSFNHIPLGTYMVDGNIIDLLIGLCQAMFELGLRVSAPLLCLFFLLTISMGFIARTVPQLNILSIGFTVRIVCGVLIVLGALGVMFSVFEHDLHVLLRRLSVFFAP